MCVCVFDQLGISLLEGNLGYEIFQSEREEKQLCIVRAALCHYLTPKLSKTYRFEGNNLFTSHGKWHIKKKRLHYLFA